MVKMEWVEGDTLDNYVRTHRDQPHVLRKLAAQWRGVLSGLRGANMAHGDLQHGNILVDSNGWMRLVDYDTMYITAFRGEKSPEIGHPNYQHPFRGADHYDESLDNFAGFIIYLSLLALAADSSLWADFNSGDNLILSKADFLATGESLCIGRLKRSSDHAVNNLAAYLEELCRSPVSDLPQLESILATGDVSFATEPRNDQDWHYQSIAATQQRVTAEPVPCPSCSYGNPPTLVYCARCATQLSGRLRKCSKCGQLIPALARFCRVCGGKQRPLG